jgi:hypothetical protein
LACLFHLLHPCNDLYLCSRFFHRHTAIKASLIRRWTGLLQPCYYRTRHCTTADFDQTRSSRHSTRNVIPHRIVLMASCRRFCFLIVGAIPSPNIVCGIQVCKNCPPRSTAASIFHWQPSSIGTLFASTTLQSYKNYFGIAQHLPCRLCCI